MHFRLLHPTTLLTAVWTCCVGAGMASLLNYSSAPGPTASAVCTWPITGEPQHSTSRPTLVMFVHPQCACSRASINELARLAAHHRSEIDLMVVFVKLAGSPSDWHKTALWSAAESIPGVRVVADQDGRIASQFGATTSGHCFGYDNAGELVFSGGITAGRGHEGDSPGQAIVASLAQGQISGQSRTCATYGCRLFSEPVQFTPQSSLTSAKTLAPFEQ